MKRRILTALLAAVLTLSLAPCAFASQAGAFQVTVTGTQCFKYAYQVAERVNELRAMEGLKALVVDETLMDTAMRRAAECSIYYGHTRPDGSGCFTVFPEGRTGQRENVAAGYASPDAVMDAWTGSEGHYENMTAADADAIGVGCFQIGGVYYWVQAITAGGTPATVARRTDRTVSVSVPVIASNFSAGMQPGDLERTMTVGETGTITVYARNLGYPAGNTPIDNFSRKSLTGGGSIASFDGDTMTITATAPGETVLSLALPGGGFRIRLTVLDAGTGFSDVSSSDWFAGDVQYAVEQGLMKGTGGTAFDPGKTITRAEVVTVLARLEGADVDADGWPWYQKAMDWSVARGVSDGTGPERPITREQFVVMLYRLVDRPAADLSVLEGFRDASSIDGWEDFPQAMAWAVETGVVRGNGSGSLNPRNTASRAEAAAILKNFQTAQAVPEQ